MSSIIENIHRIGNFTSSENYKLMSNGKAVHGLGAPAITYIDEINTERKLGRSISTDTFAKDAIWGSFLEARVFDLLPFEYELCSDTTALHPNINCWAGSTDLIVVGEKIGEIKCYQPKNFAKYTDLLLSKDVPSIKKDAPKEYWQMISNAIINNTTNAEAITYMPYKSELPIIREMAENYDGEHQFKYRFIAEGDDATLAYLPDDGYYKNLNRFEFKVPQEDIDLLTERVLLAETMLIKR